MQKNFITFCFILALFPAIACASVSSIAGKDTTAAQLNGQELTEIQAEELPDPDNVEEVREFFKKRLENATRMDTDKPIDLSSPSSTDILHSPEYYAEEREKNKPLFQKMYEQALSSLHSNDDKDNTQSENNNAVDKEAVETATRFFRLIRQKRHDEMIEPQIPTVSVPLPSGRRILAPAREHIPYLLSYIDIQANGYLKIEDTITIVADNKEFAQGLTRVFPKYARSSQKIELILDKVTVNGSEIPYTAEEIGTQIVLKPKYRQKLNPGVYTYKFTYMVNNKLYRIQDGNVLLRWNLTGLPLNMFITSANTIISVPSGHSFKNIATYIGEKDIFTSERVNTYKLAQNVFAFSSNTPVLNGESVEIVAILDQSVLFDDFDKSFSAFLNNWGNVLYAFLGFIAILFSFILSLLTLKKSDKNNKFTPSYNGALMRSVLVGKYDRIAFVSALLDIYRKDAIDITNENGRIFFAKRQQDSSKLNKTERKIISALFSRKMQRTEANNVNNKRFKNAYRILEKNINRQLDKLRILQNIGYLIFSIIMLVLTLIFISAISVNMAQSLIILLSTTGLYAFYIWIWRHKFKRWYITIPMKVLALLSLLLIWIFSSIYIGSITSIIIAATVYIIYVFVALFGEHNNFINEAKEVVTRYKEYLITNAESINLSNAFVMQQSNIFALSISEYFPQNVSNQRQYKLDIAENLRRTLIGIL